MAYIKTSVRGPFLKAAKEAGLKTISRKSLEIFVVDHDLKFPSWLVQSPKYRGSERGTYDIPYTGVDVAIAELDTVIAELDEEIKNLPVEASTVSDIPAATFENVPAVNASLVVDTKIDIGNIIPDRDSLFIAPPNMKTVRKLIRSGIFAPTFVTGLSGNGKSKMIKQACAVEKRKYVRVGITQETGEDSLIGGFRLIDGETRFFKGPVILAMEIGAILNLDEIDLGDPEKIMCLQSILEGEGYFIKSINEWVYPAKGFQIFATANTKGLGSENGEFVGTQILNEAFLDRFPITLEQEYATPAAETKILQRLMTSLDALNEDTEKFIQCLIQWAGNIRSLHGVELEHTISTRRLCQIVSLYPIFEDRLEVIKHCTNRFDSETKVQFLDFYSKIDETAYKVEVEEPNADDITALDLTGVEANTSPSSTSSNTTLSATGEIKKEDIDKQKPF